MEKLYDLVVIGAGPGGYPAALKAAEMGKKTAVVEAGELGGTCLNSGCIPTKTLLHTSGLYRQIRAAAPAGLEGDGIRADMVRLQKHKREVIASLRSGIEAECKRNKVDLYRGRAIITGEHTVEIMERQGEADGRPESGGDILTAEYILAAAGSAPALLPIPGLDQPGVENSTTLLEKEALYEHLVIIGGGVIGMEFATLYSDLGAKVTVLEAMERILPGMDREISQNLKMILKKRGVDIHTGAAVKEVVKAAAGFTCVYTEKGKEGQVTSDGLMVAVGRRACGGEIWSEEMRRRVRVERGRISVNAFFQTDIPSVYAVGDVIGGIQLAHAATAEGYCAISHMFGGIQGKNMEVIPSCVYTDPEIACVGTDADEAKAAGQETAVGKYVMTANGKSVLSGEERGFIKIVARKSDRVVIGAQLMCARATDMIGELGLAVAARLTAEELARFVAPHPTYAEGIGEAAGELLKKLPPA